MDADIMRPLVCSAVTAGLTWLASRKKNQADAATVLVNTALTLAEAARKEATSAISMLGDLRVSNAEISKKYEKTTAHIGQLTASRDKLLRRVDDCEKDRKGLHHDMELLRRRLSELVTTVAREGAVYRNGGDGVPPIAAPVNQEVNGTKPE